MDVTGDRRCGLGIGGVELSVSVFHSTIVHTSADVWTTAGFKVVVQLVQEMSPLHRPCSSHQHCLQPLV
ncbi:hypothetical protein BJ165DRAFT_1487352, partial [Panaeolus papilionaceus]